VRRPGCAAGIPRPSKLSKDQIRQVRALRDSGESISDLVRSFNVSHASIFRALQSAELMALGVSGDAVADGVRAGS